MGSDFEKEGGEIRSKKEEVSFSRKDSSEKVWRSYMVRGSSNRRNGEFVRGLARSGIIAFHDRCLVQNRP